MLCKFTKYTLINIRFVTEAAQSYSHCSNEPFNETQENKTAQPKHAQLARCTVLLNMADDI